MRALDHTSYERFAFEQPTAVGMSSAAAAARAAIGAIVFGIAIIALRLADTAERRTYVGEARS